MCGDLTLVLMHDNGYKSLQTRRESLPRLRNEPFIDWAYRFADTYIKRVDALQKLDAQFSHDARLFVTERRA